jgi:hypothetical protein
MTQTPFAPAQAPAPQAEQIEEQAGSRRTALVAGGLVAALVLGGGGYFLLSGGSDSSDQASAPPVSFAHHPRPAAPKPATAKAAKPAVKVPATSTVPIGRDPFKALYVQPAAAPAGSGATGSTAPATGSTTGTSTGTATGTAPAPTASYALTLLKVSGGTNGSAPLFTWSVGGTSKTVLAAQKFGKYGELVTLSWVRSSAGRAIGAVVQVGDDEPVAVRLGEKITVK